MRALVLRFDAPLMSFGGVLVDQHNKTDLFPYRAMLTGLLANALGYEHGETTRHEALQRRLRYAARRDRAGERIVDYQTVDFSSGPMRDGLGWTTWGRLEERKGGAASEGTHIRYRHYLADAVVTVAVTLDPVDESPTLDDVAGALAAPARPLFIGRKCCIPSEPIFQKIVEANSLREILETEPRALRADSRKLPAIWPSSDGEDDASVPVVRVEDRDWSNAIHVGRRFYVEGFVDPPGEMS